MQKISGIGLMLLSLSLLAGCGGGDEPADDSAAAGPGSGQKLIGVWFGRASLDAQRLQQHLATLPDETTRAGLQSAAETFTATEIAMMLSDDGTLEIEVEMKLPGGQAFRDTANGTWKTVRQDNRSVVIEITEKLPNGMVDVSQKRIDFLSDDDHFKMSRNVGPELADFNPQIVFERQVLGPEEVAQNPDSTIRQ